MSQQLPHSPLIRHFLVTYQILMLRWQTDIKGGPDTALDNAYWAVLVDLQGVLGAANAIPAIGDLPSAVLACHAHAKEDVPALVERVTTLESVIESIREWATSQMPANKPHRSGVVNEKARVLTYLLRRLPAKRT